LKKKIIIVGGGSHAYSILDILIRNSLKKYIFGYIDNKETFLPLKYIGNDGVLKNLKKKNYILINGIGINIQLREKVYSKFEKEFNFMTLIDKSAIVSKLALVKNGSVIFPLSYVGPGVIIGENSVIHSKVSIEHNSLIEKNIYIGPGSTICGTVIIKKNTFIGGGSFLKQGIIIGNNNLIGAGSVILKNFLQNNCKIYGNPAKKIYDKN